VVLGIEDVVLDPPPGEVAGQALRLLDRDRADENRLAGPVAGHDVVGDRLPLGVLRLVDGVRLVPADVGPVGGNLEDLEVVDVRELGGLGLGGTGHAGELLVEAEVVLDRDGASVWFSCWIGTLSFASTAWWRPSDHRRPGRVRPVNSSTISTSRFCTM